MSGYYKIGLLCEAEDIIEDVVKNDCITPAQGWCVGNALKYLLRLGKKSEHVADDLYKAEDYIHRARCGKWIETEGE